MQAQYVVEVESELQKINAWRVPRELKARSICKTKSVAGRVTWGTMVIALWNFVKCDETAE